LRNIALTTGSEYDSPEKIRNRKHANMTKKLKLKNFKDLTTP